VSRGYSHPIVAPALLAAPVLLSGGSPVLAFNVSLLTGLVLTAWATWLLARQWTGSPRAALVAGALAAFHLQILTRLPHLDAAHAWGLPLTMYLADAMMERPSRRTRSAARRVRRADRRDVAVLAPAVVAEAVTHVMGHLKHFGDEAPAVVDGLTVRRDLWLVASDTRGHRLYEVRREDASR
jgi:hypothetical protein